MCKIRKFSWGGGIVVDVGCGLGGLLQHIQADKRVGLDASENVIMAARELGDGSVDFKTGSFYDIEESNVDYLVTLGFMHGSRESTWIHPYREAAEKNHVRHFIVDTVPEEGTSHFLDWSKIMPENYKRTEMMGPFLGGRYVEVWSRKVPVEEKQNGI